MTTTKGRLRSISDTCIRVCLSWSILRNMEWGNLTSSQQAKLIKRTKSPRRAVREKAWRQIFELSQPLIRGRIRLHRDNPAYDDYYSQTLYDLIRAVRNYDPTRGSFLNYLSLTAKSAVSTVSQYRGRSCRIPWDEITSYSDWEWEGAPFEDRHNLTVQNSDAHQAALHIWPLARKRLTRLERLAFWCVYYRQLTYLQTAEIVTRKTGKATTEKVIDNALLRCQIKMRDWSDRYLQEHSLPL